MPLNARQTLFVAEYLVDLNASAAARRAGYSAHTADRTGYDLLRHPEISEAIRRGAERKEKKALITADEVVGELKRVAMIDIGALFREDGSLRPVHEMPEHARRAVSGIDIQELFDKDGPIGVLKKLRLNDKVRALELLGKHLGIFSEKVEHAGKVVVEIHRYGEQEDSE